MVVKIAELAITTVAGLMTLLVLFVVSALISWLLIILIRLFVPNFALYKSPYARKEIKEGVSTKKVALDFILAERRKRQAEKLQIIRDVVNLPRSSEKDTWTLDLLAQELLKPPKSVRKKQIADQGTWSVALFTEGMKPWALCHKERGVHAFANLSRDRWITMPSNIAHTLAQILTRTGRDVRPIPANALARLIDAEQKRGQPPEQSIAARA